MVNADSRIPLKGKGFRQFRIAQMLGGREYGSDVDL